MVGYAIAGMDTNLIYILDASGGKNSLKWCFSSLDGIIDSLHLQEVKSYVLL